MNQTLLLVFVVVVAAAGSRGGRGGGRFWFGLVFVFCFTSSCTVISNSKNKKLFLQGYFKR